MWLVKQEVVQMKHYITIILYQELYTYVVPVNVECSYKVYFSRVYILQTRFSNIKFTQYDR